MTSVKKQLITPRAACEGINTSVNVPQAEQADKPCDHDWIWSPRPRMGEDGWTFGVSYCSLCDQRVDRFLAPGFVEWLVDNPIVTNLRGLQNQGGDHVSP